MEVEVSVSLSRAELWTLLESVPASNEVLLAKLSEARSHIERPGPAVYGGATTLRPKVLSDLDQLRGRVHDNMNKIYDSPTIEEGI
jgi:hypothetical protein